MVIKINNMELAINEISIIDGYQIIKSFFLICT